MGDPAKNSVIKDAKYIYINVVGGVQVVAPVFAPKSGRLGRPPKNVE